MPSFDEMLIGTFTFNVILFFLSFPSERRELAEYGNKLTRAQRAKVKRLIAKRRKNICLFFMCYLSVCILLAFIFQWDSDLLGTGENKSESVPSLEQMDTTPQNAESAAVTTAPEATVVSYFEDFWGEIYETHSPNDGITASVDFREWDSSIDFDLRADAHAEESGLSFFAHQSNMFNSIDGRGSEGDRIVSDIHLPINAFTSASRGNLYISGFIVATKETQGSGAYADVAILVDGEEKWRTTEPITSDTVQPINFVAGIPKTASEVIIRTSCVPIGKGLSLGYIGIGLTHNENELPPISNEEEKPEGPLFVNRFESHSPNDNVVNQVVCRDWDTFSDADLRDGQYTDSGGIFLKMSNYFNSIGTGSSSLITSEIHLPINSQWDLNGLMWTGSIIAEQSTQGSTAYADIAILVDGNEKWRTSEPITGSTVPPTEFSIDLTEAKYEVIIQTQCNALDSGLALGFVNLGHEYKTS